MSYRTPCWETNAIIDMIRLVVCVPIVLAVAAPASAADYGWQGGTKDWDTPINWGATVTYPGSHDTADTALIDYGGPSSYTVTLNVSPAYDLVTFTLDSTFAALVMDGELGLSGTGANSSTLDKGVVEMNDGSEFHGAGTLYNYVDLTVRGDADIRTATFVQGKRFEDRGTVTILADGGASSLTVADGFTNYGTITLSSKGSANAATLWVVGSDVIENYEDGVITVAEGAGGARTITANLQNNAAATIHVNQDLLLNKGNSSIQNAGTLNIAPGKTVTVNGTGVLTFTQSAGTLDNQGGLLISDERFVFSGGEITGNVVVLDDGELTMGVNAVGAVELRRTVEYSGNIGSGAAVTVLGGPNDRDAVLDADNGFSNSGTITLVSEDPDDYARAARLLIRNGTLTNNVDGIINVDAGDGGSRALTASLTNNGTINVNTDVSLNRTSAVYTNNAAFNVAPGATVTYGGGGTPHFTQAGGTLSNEGAFVVGKRFDFAGGQITGDAVVLEHNSELNITATGAGAFELHGTVDCTGDVASGQSLTVVGGYAGSSGRLDANDGFTNSGTITLTSQSDSHGATLFIGSGTLTNNAGGIINVNTGDGGSRALTASLANNGTINVNTDVSLNRTGAVYANNATFNVAAGGAVTVGGNTPTFTQAGGTLDNQGTFLLSGSTGRFDFTGGHITGSAVVLDYCELNISATGGGAFDLRRNIDYSGDLADGQSLTLRGTASLGTSRLSADNGFSNSGVITLTSDTASYGASLEIGTGTLTNHVAGVVHVNEGAGGGRSILANLTNDGKINVNTDVTLNKTAAAYTNNAAFNVATGAAVTVGGHTATFTQAGGTLDNQGTFLLSGTNGRFNFAGGRITGNAVIIDSSELNITTTGAGAFQFRRDIDYSGDLASQQALTLRGESTYGTARLSADNGFSNSGVITLTSDTASYGASLEIDSGQFANNTDGQLHVAAGAGASRTLTAEFANAGLFDIDRSLYVNRSGADHVNAGVIDLAEGAILEVAGGGNVTLTNDAGGTIRGDGSLDVDDPDVSFTNEGLVSPGTSPGTLDFSGDYVQSVTGELLIEIGGYTPGSEYDQLVVDGSADLSGLLDVALWGDFSPGVGDNFVVLTTTGNLTDNGLQLAAEDVASWNLVWNAGELQVEYVPEPSTPALLTGGLVVLAMIPRRRGKKAISRRRSVRWSPAHMPE